MAERCELAVQGISYVGWHSVEGDVYQIELEVNPTPDAPWRIVTLKFRPAEAAFLARMMQSTPPPAGSDKHLLEQVAAHDT